MQQEFLAVQGCTAIFNGWKPLKMKASENRIFHSPCPEQPMMG